MDTAFTENFFSVCCSVESAVVKNNKLIVLSDMKVELKKDKPTGDRRFSAENMEKARRENRIRKF